MTRIGTAHFKSLTHAEAYYAKQGSLNTARDVMAKLAAGEIMLGPPPMPVGTELGCDSDGRYFINELSAWEKHKASRGRERTPTQEHATMAQLVNRSIKAAGGYPPANGWKVVGYTFERPKQSASLVTMRNKWRINAQVSRVGAHHMKGRVYTRLIATGVTFDEAIENAMARVDLLRGRAKLQDAIDEAGKLD